MNSQIQYPMLRKAILQFCLFICILAIYTHANAQINPEKPPRPIKIIVNLARFLNFGTIIPTSSTGGTLKIDYDGTPTPTGDILLLHSYLCTSLLFIVDAEPGVLINILYPVPDPVLSSGGNHLQMHLGPPNVELQTTSNGSQFITKAKFTNIYIGGTLDIGSLAANPAGNYLGSFDVTFIQQ